jgi:creatinine amidohydrolase
MRDKVWINELTWEDVEEYLKTENTVLIPIGSTEQHGPAGPLGVDTYAAIAIAEDCAKQTGILTTPPLWFGDSPHHLDFAGTICLRSETLINVVKDIISSLAKNGFKKFIIVNGHKGTNLSPLTIACREIHQYELPDIDIVITDPLFLATKAGEIMSTPEHHAGELEISHVMYKNPGLVKEDKLTDVTIDFDKIFGGFIKKDLFSGKGACVDYIWNSSEQKKFAPSGSFSASRNSSKERGKFYHDNMVENLVEFIQYFRNNSIRDE